MKRSLLKDFEVIDEREVSYEHEEELDEVITDLNQPKEKSLLSKIWEFVSTGSAKPYRESEQDGKSKQSTEEGNEFLVRYMYSPQTVKANIKRILQKNGCSKKGL